MLGLSFSLVFLLLLMLQLALWDTRMLVSSIRQEYHLLLGHDTSIFPDYVPE